MFCRNCGKEIPDESQFCKHCGNKVKNVEETNNMEVVNNSNKQIKATFHRQKKFTGCLVPMRVYIDGQLIASLDNNGVYETYVTPGKHKIIVEMWSAVSEREVEFSDEYSSVYLELTIKMGMFTNKAEIATIRNEK